jgi:hypothetical protein
MPQVGGHLVDDGEMFGGWIVGVLAWVCRSPKTTLNSVF